MLPPNLFLLLFLYRPTDPPLPSPPSHTLHSHKNNRQGTYEHVERAVGRLIARAEKAQGKQDPVAVVGRGYHTMLMRAVKGKVGDARETKAERGCRFVSLLYFSPPPLSLEKRGTN